MKYRLKGNLPFMTAGTVFKKASSLCCGDGWAIPAKPKAPGQTADNPVITFNDHQNKVLDEIIEDDNWIEVIPESKAEMLDIYEAGNWSRDELLKAI